MAETTADGPSPEQGGAHEPSRRDFIYVAAGSLAAVGAAATVWPFIDQMNPAADTLALSTTDVDLGSIQEGQQIVVIWQGKPVFVRHRTGAEIAAAQRDDYANLKDPATDASRLLQANGEAGRAAFIVLQAACTHLGCIPTFAAGDYRGWMCACHGSQYDTSGRIRRGPAPLNLVIAPYVYTSETAIRIG
ncbi:MAG: ubiquinol-cytochrome c reductase iron-sulfur subunit [Hyphomonadaceae bacterium]